MGVTKIKLELSNLLNFIIAPPRGFQKLHLGGRVPQVSTIEIQCNLHIQSVRTEDNLAELV